MIKIFIFFLSYYLIFSEQILVFSVQEKIMQNSVEGDLLPLIVTPKEDVNEDITIQCNGNIRYRTSDGGWPDLGDVDPKPKIPSGTKAGTEIKFNCLVDFPIENVNITLELDNSLTNWIEDENNKQIQFVPKYLVSPSSLTSKNLEKNDLIELNMTLMSSVNNEVAIENGTFILKNNDDKSTIKLLSCSSIPKNQQKGTLKITCKVEEEVKEGSFSLELVEGKKIDNIEPKVDGTISFSAKYEIEENEKDNNNSSNFNIISLLFISLSILLLL